MTRDALPRGWSHRTLSELAAQSAYPIGDGDHGAIKPSTYQKHGIPYIRVADIVHDEIVNSQMAYIPEDVHMANPKSRLLPGDIVIAKTGATIGKVAIIPESIREANTTSSVGKVTLDPAKADARYVYRFMQSPAFKAQMWRVSSKTAQPGFNIENLKVFKIPIPETVEQQKYIAKILDEADALRVKCQAALAQLDTLTQSIFFEMFGDPAIPTRTVGQLLESGALLSHKDGNHGSLYPRADDFGDEGIPFVSAKAVSDDGAIDDGLVENLREERANRLKIGWISKGDVLLAHNASVGKVALYDGRFERALIGTSLTAFRPNPEALDSNYLAAALRARAFQRQLEKNMGQTTRNQVPITAQRDLKVGLPRIELQRKFAQKAVAVEALRVSHRAAEAQFRALFASLQQRAFGGGLVS